VAAGTWLAVVARFVAARTGTPADGLVPRLISHVALATSVAGYEQWLAEPTSDLAALFDAAFAELPLGFAHHERSAPT
jgi:TetR/AcrR family transcriptional regulator, regulator of mycofactocin system